MGGPVEPFTVDDVWAIRGDPVAMRHAAVASRTLIGRWVHAEPVAAELDAAAEILHRGQALLTRLLERLEVPMSWQSRTLTFFPHDEGDLAAVGEAVHAAGEVHVRVQRALDRHRHAIEALVARCGP